MSNKQRKSRYDDEEEDIEYKYASANRKKKSRKRKKKKKSKFKKVLLTMFIIILMIVTICLGVVVAYGYNLFTQINQDGSFNKNEIDVNDGITTTGYQNIVLYGVDARDQDNSYEGSLSDVIMIVSINQDTKKIKLASVYRDTYLQNPKTKSYDKITHAFGDGRTFSFNEYY